MPFLAILGKTERMVLLAIAFFMKTSFSSKNRIFQKIHNSPKSDGVGSPLIPMVLSEQGNNILNFEISRNNLEI